MKRILVAPLDWGLGHASRCIPIIDRLLARSCDVLLGGAGDALALLQREYPQLPVCPLPAYAPSYSRRDSMVWTMARQLPHFVKVIRQEHRLIEKLVTQHTLHGIISDNRFGAWSAQVPSVFITHQSNILMPRRFGWLAPVVRAANERHMKKFTTCWIPDYPNDDNLAGALGKFDATKLSATHIGPLSRFQWQEPATEYVYDVVAICSGPEPQRSLLEDLLTRQLRDSGLRYQLVRGVLEEPARRDSIVWNYATRVQLADLLAQAQLVIARSGYSTVMDMAAMGKKAIFIPTPGQTEQEYLAHRLKTQGIAYTETQDRFDLQRAWAATSAYRGFTSQRPTQALDDALDHWLSLL